MYSPQHFLMGQVAMVLSQFAIQITGFTQYSKQNLNYISPVSWLHKMQ